MGTDSIFRMITNLHIRIHRLPSLPFSNLQCKCPIHSLPEYTGGRLSGLRLHLPEVRRPDARSARRDDAANMHLGTLPSDRLSFKTHTSSFQHDLSTRLNQRLPQWPSPRTATPWSPGMDSYIRSSSQSLSRRSTSYSFASSTLHRTRQTVRQAIPR